MEKNFKINLENLSEEERDQLLFLVEKSNQPKPKKRWRAKKHQTYFCMLSSGEIWRTTELNNPTDNVSHSLGNYFRSRADARFAKEKRLIYQELKDYAIEHNKKVFDWNNAAQEKFCICLAHRPDSSTVLAIDNMQTVEYPNTVYFSSPEIALNAIEEIGEEKIKKYLFNVKEED